MSLIPTQTMTQAGLAPVFQACAVAGDTWQPSSQTFLVVKNSDSASHQVTVVTTAIAYSQPIADIVVIVPAGGEVYMGPYEPGEVQQPGADIANLTYSAVTGMTIAAVAS